MASSALIGRRENHNKRTCWYSKSKTNEDNVSASERRPKMTENKLISWLHKNYKEELNEVTSVNELIPFCCVNFGEQFKDTKTIGRHVRIAFPNINRTRQRCHQDWTKSSYVYKGLGKRNPVENTTAATISLKAVSKLLPSDFFIIEYDDIHLHFGKDTHLKCNGNMVIMQVTLSNDGHIDVFVGTKSVLSQSGISNVVHMDQSSIDLLLTSLKSIRFCQGIIQNEYPSEVKENVIIQKNNHKEYVLYSTSCHKILDITSFRSTSACIKCRTMARHQTSPIPHTLELSEEPTAYTNKGEHVEGILTDHSDHEDALHRSKSDDILSVLKEKAPYLNNSQLNLIKSQLQNSSVSDKHARRWDGDVIQMSLTMWTRSPKTYENLLKSGCLILPSVSTLSRYKNVVQQHAGLNEDAFKWMYMEARHRNIPEQGYYGGLVLDEMSIQEDVQIVKKGGGIKLVGFSDISGTSSSGSANIANHVLQFVFHGFTGFRFPIAQFPTNQANAPEIYSSFWDIMSSLERWGFHALYVSIDGASTNRSYIKMHFQGSPGQYDMETHNPFSDNPLIFLADPSHLFKKIRNNLLKSGPEKWHSRELTISGKPVVWKMWIDSYEWDQQHGLSIHHRLSNDHIHPNKADIMRNHLAEEVLDADMLNLMRSYQQHLGDGASVLDGAVSLLEQTSALIHIFNDRRPIVDPTDVRLQQLKAILCWFKKWEAMETTKHLMSWETREDIQFLISGFTKLAIITTQQLQISLTPQYINSDIIENHFSQQRGLYHGFGANPNYNQYRTATNSIILGQCTISKKANAATRKMTQADGALPFKHLCKKLRM